MTGSCPRKTACQAAVLRAGLRPVKCRYFTKSLCYFTNLLQGAMQFLSRPGSSRSSPLSEPPAGSPASMTPQSRATNPLRWPSSWSRWACALPTAPPVWTRKHGQAGQASERHPARRRDHHLLWWRLVARHASCERREPTSARKAAARGC